MICAITRSMARSAVLVVCAILLLPVTAMAKPASSDGERAFQRCYSCHSVNKGDTGLSGPNLYGLKHRPAGSDPDFDYSAAFKQFSARKPRWTKALLDRFLTDPESVVAGNQMGFFGLKDPKERAAIIAYVLASE